MTDIFIRVRLHNWRSCHINPLWQVKQLIKGIWNNCQYVTSIPSLSTVNNDLLRTLSTFVEFIFWRLASSACAFEAHCLRRWLKCSNIAEPGSAGVKSKHNGIESLPHASLQLTCKGACCSNCMGSELLKENKCCISFLNGWLSSCYWISRLIEQFTD